MFHTSLVDVQILEPCESVSSACRVGFLSQLMFSRPYSRKLEAEADKVGMQLAAKVKQHDCAHPIILHCVTRDVISLQGSLPLKHYQFDEWSLAWYFSLKESQHCQLLYETPGGTVIKPNKVTLLQNAVCVVDSWRAWVLVTCGRVLCCRRARTCALPRCFGSKWRSQIS